LASVNNVLGLFEPQYYQIPSLSLSKSKSSVIPSPSESLGTQTAKKLKLALFVSESDKFFG
jgi:hypothetical protein